MMKDITQAFRNKPQVSRLTPDKEIESNVEQFAAQVVVPAAVVDNPDIGSPAEVAAPEGVVAEELAAEAAENGVIEAVDVVRGRLKAHLGVGQVEDEVLPLVLDVVGLEPEEEPQPVQEVVLWGPFDVRRLPEVAHRAEGCLRRTDFWVPQ